MGEQSTHLCQAEFGPSLPNWSLFGDREKRGALLSGLEARGTLTVLESCLSYSRLCDLGPALHLAEPRHRLLCNKDDTSPQLLFVGAVIEMESTKELAQSGV